MSTQTQTQSPQFPTSDPSPQIIRIELPTGTPPTPAPASGGLSDSSPLVLIAFAILVKVTMDYLSPANRGR